MFKVGFIVFKFAKFRISFEFDLDFSLFDGNYGRTFTVYLFSVCVRLSC